MNVKNKAIGVFDSGLGGLTSVRELQRILPDEKIIYFGDTGRVPYGTRSNEIITKYALDDLNFLCSFGIKAVLVACGTVSSIALDTLKENFDIPVMGVVSPACLKASAATKTKKVALLATPATVKNNAYKKELSGIDKDIDFAAVSCPMFVPLVENGYVDFSNIVTRTIAKEYLLELVSFDPDTIILGCTHYPLIKDIIKDCAKEIFGHEVFIVDCGECAAYAVKSYLEENALVSDDKGFCDFYVSDETHNFMQSASLFLGQNISSVQKINILDYAFSKQQVFK